MARRTPETLADYLVVEICPSLIMVLVGSLLYFLVEVFYQGEFELRTLWVLAMFVLGIVCLARLSMEEGYAYASMYAVPLGVLVGIALSRFVRFGGPLASSSLLVNWALMGWVWWCAHKLTWDCTLIDDSQDASGEGLLQQMGLDREATPAGPEATTQAPRGTEPGRSDAGEEDEQKDWWQKWIEPDRRPHPPGVWVVYFSLGALPMFGIGGRFISLENLESRRWCFWMLVLYVASAMALLLATSFLGLRKYLRQRRLAMPLDMTAMWVGAGSVLIVATIVVASLVPRPSPEYSIAQLIKIDSPELWASRWGFGPEGAKSKADQPTTGGAEQQAGQQADQQGGGKADPQNKGGSPQPGKQGSGDSGNKNGGSQQSQQGQSQQGQSQQGQSQQGQSQQGQSQDNQSQGNESQGGESNSKTNPAEGKNSQDQSKQGPANQNQNQQQSGDESSNSGKKTEQGESANDNQQSKSESGESSPGQSGRPADNSSQSPQLIEHVQKAIGALGGLLKAALYVAIALVAAYLAWRYRAELLAAWKKLLEELAALWPGLFGKKAQEPAAEAAASLPPRPFAAFADPFASGAAARMSPAEVVRYTFAALEAWGRENGCPRAIGQTPHEFAAAIGDVDRTLAREAAQLAELYARMAYAPPAAIRTSFEPLRSLWRKMAAPAVEVVGA
jgi:hypothetical protein